MIDYMIMLLILAFLLFALVYKAKLVPVNNSFFDKDNALAMRGFWSLVIVLVHVPVTYTNRIQDMIGSFAYIGVTFFFMSSAYGLTLSRDSNPGMLRHFWKRRLSKIMAVPVIVLLVFLVINFLIFRDLECISGVFGAFLWVVWLLACYLFFWISNQIFKSGNTWKISTCIMIALGSLVMYALQKMGIVTVTTWAPECYGFIWGIILADFRGYFVDKFKDKWLIKNFISMLIAAILGVLYLKFKYIPLAGDYLLKIVLGLSILVFMLAMNVRIELGNKINHFLGRISFEVYMVHSSVFIILERMFRWNSSGVYILISMLVSLVIGSLIHVVTKKANLSFVK